MPARKAPAVSVILWDRIGPTAVRSLSAAWSSLGVYTLSRQGQMTTYAGPPALTPAALKSKRIVWVGIPPNWVKNHAGMPDGVASYHVGHTSRFEMVRQFAPVRVSVEAALQGAKEARDAAKVEAVKLAKASAREERRRRHEEAPPFYYPPGMA